MANPETPHDKKAPDELKQEKIHDDGSRITRSHQGEEPDKSTGKDVDKKDSHGPKQEKISDQGEGLEKLQVSVVKLEVVPSNKEDDGGSDMQELTPRAEITPVHAEKVPDDGFNWRKYGQKNVKGNEFVRCYYRCTYPFCQVKRQVERSHDGQITDMVYLGQHIHHPGSVNPPASPASKKLDKSPSMNFKEKLFEVKISAYPQVSIVASSEMAVIRQNYDTKCALPRNDKVQDNDTSNDSPVSKKKKRGPDSADPTAGDTPSIEARTVVHTVSEVDIVHDGHRWRKYGQKMVKGNTNPRSYYRCSWVGCPARKLIERASHDQKVVITTYEGQHLHSMALERTVSIHNTDCLNASPSGHYEDSMKHSSNAKSAHGDIVLEATTTTTTVRKIDEDNDRKAKKRAGIGHLVGFKMSVLPDREIELNPDELLNSDGASHGPRTDVTDEHSHAQLHANNAAVLPGFGELLDFRSTVVRYASHRGRRPSEGTVFDGVHFPLLHE